MSYSCGKDGSTHPTFSITSKHLFDKFDPVDNGHISGWLNFSITLRSRRHSIDTEASATLKGRRGFRVYAATLREDLVVLGGFLIHPTTTNMNIAWQQSDPFLPFAIQRCVAS